MTRGGFTFAHAAPHLHRDAGFDGRGDGHIHAKPLYWRPGGAANGLPIVATEPTVCRRSMRPAMPFGAARCPVATLIHLVFTGTPVIDPAGRVLSGQRRSRARDRASGLSPTVE